MIALKSLDIPLCFFDESHAARRDHRQAHHQGSGAR
jgi:hypothetical protein